MAEVTRRILSLRCFAFLGVFVSSWLELSNKYHEDSKTRRNTKNLAKKASAIDSNQRHWDYEDDEIARRAHKKLLLKGLPGVKRES